MSMSNLENGAQTVRPKSLSASSLLQRAAVGLLILFVGIATSAWLYDASITANASDQARLDKGGSCSRTSRDTSNTLAALRPALRCCVHARHVANVMALELSLSLRPRPVDVVFGARPSPSTPCAAPLR